MPPSEFQASVRTRDGVAVLDLRGLLDGQTEGALNGAYARAAEGNASLVVLNFTDTSYIDSTGIAFLVGLLARARAERRTLAAYGLSDHYREIFEITRLSDFISIYDDEAGAVGHA